MAFFASLTRRGRLFLALGVALLATGIGMGMSDLTRVGALLLVLPVLTSLISRRHPLTFGVARRPVPARVQIDEPARVELSIVNPSRARSPVIRAEEIVDYALGDRPRGIIPPLRRGETHTMTYAVRSSVRGRHRLGPLTIGVSDPFGLTDRDLTLQSTAEILVLPRVVPLVDASRGSHGVGSEGTVPHMVALHGEDDVSVRDYRHGDDLRRVHWPATARTGNLMVRQEDRPAMKRAVVLLDSRHSVHGATPSRSLEWAVTMAASVVAHVHQQGYAVHLVTASTEPGVGQDSATPAAAMEALALVSPGPDEDLSGVLHAAGPAVGPGGLIICLIGACTDDDARAVASLRPPGSRAVAVILGSGESAEATALHLQQAGWTALVVDQSISWQAAWSRLSGGRPVGASR